jgi:hypothetical protein
VCNAVDPTFTCQFDEFGTECAPNACDGLDEGTPCFVYGEAGVCASSFGDMACDTSVCLEAGTPCGLGFGLLGMCAADGFGGFSCNATSAGGIDGVGVDVCGNVYASEFVNGNVYRIDPTGNIELIATLPSSWIPNVEWGKNLGGFLGHTLYVADRDQGRLFALEVGIAGGSVPHP